MPKELTLSMVKAVLPDGKQKNMTTEVVEEINKLSNDPDYGQEFLETYMDYLDIYSSGRARNHDSYVNGLKFFCMVEGGNNLTDSYIKTFPDRFADRTRGKQGDPQELKDMMRGEASRYNRTRLMAEIRKAASVPVKLVHRHLLHESILEQAKLMRSAKSEMVRHLAAKALMQELKEEEESVLSIKVEDGAKSAIDELRIATAKLASMQREKVVSNQINLKDVADAVIIQKEETE